jgi:outer membrane receptor protein involved in Fe transport
MLYGHYSDIDDMIVPVYEGPWSEDPTKDVWRRRNIARAKVCGAEIKARYTLSPYCRLEGGYSCTDTEARDSGRQLPYDPGSSAFLKAVVGGRLDTYWTWSGFVTLRAVFDRSAWSWQPAPGAPVGDPTGGTTKLDDYQKLDAGVSVKYQDRYELFVNVCNILGQDYENLDDVFTVLDGEPTIMVGGKATW